MRRGRTRRRSDDEPADRADPAVAGTGSTSRWRANGWPVVPVRLYLAALFGFAGYAKLSYPNFFDPDSPNGFKAAVAAAKDGTPIGGLLGPLADHPSVFGHLTAYAEIAIGLGLLVGLLTRFAALGGMVLTTMILLSIDWGGVKEYTGSSGWFTSVDLMVAVALSAFLLGGPGPFALDNLFVRARDRQRARDDAEPGFRDSEFEDSRRRLQGEPPPAPGPVSAAAGTGRRAGYRPAAGHRLPRGRRRRGGACQPRAGPGRSGTGRLPGRRSGRRLATAPASRTRSTATTPNPSRARSGPKAGARRTRPAAGYKTAEPDEQARRMTAALGTGRRRGPPTMEPATME